MLTTLCNEVRLFGNDLEDDVLVVDVVVECHKCVRRIVYQSDGVCVAFHEVTVLKRIGKPSLLLEQ